MYIMVGIAHVSSASASVPNGCCFMQNDCMAPKAPSEDAEQSPVSLLGGATCSLTRSAAPPRGLPVNRGDDEHSALPRRTCDCSCL